MQLASAIRSRSRGRFVMVVNPSDELHISAAFDVPGRSCREMRMDPPREACIASLAQPQVPYIMEYCSAARAGGGERPRPWPSLRAVSDP